MSKSPNAGKYGAEKLRIRTLFTRFTDSHVYISDYKFSKIANEIIEIPKRVKKGVSYLQKVRVFLSLKNILFPLLSPARLWQRL